MMNRLFISIFLFCGLFFVFSGGVFADILDFPPNEETVRVKVETVDVNCTENPTSECKLLNLKFLSGKKSGENISIEIPYPSINEEDNPYKEGQVYYGTVGEFQGEETFYMGEIYRLPGVFVLFVIFVAFVVWFGRKQGILSLLALFINFSVLVFVIVPGVYNNISPIFLILTVGPMLMFVTIFLTYGFNYKSLSAFMGSVFGLIITSVLAYFFISITKMTGFASEEAAFLHGTIDLISLKDVLFLGIIVGMMGVLDDVTIGQASTVFQLHSANSKLKMRELYNRAIIVGKDHVASMVNTLIIAYAGASFPLFLLLAGNGGSGFFSIINMEVISEELLKMLVGSIGFISAVPFTTLVASKLAVIKSKRKALL